MQQPIKIFISYAHEDEALRERLDKHLSHLKQQNLISVWHDRDIKAGTEWKYEIDTYLEQAHLILLLISPDFMASEYCYGTEMQRAMERHQAGGACVIPIILRPVDWKNAPFGKLQALPRDDKPVSLWRDRDDALDNIVRGIREAIEIPIDEVLLAVLNLQKEKCQRQNVAVNTAHLLLTLLEIHNGVAQRALDTLKPDLAAMLHSQLEQYIIQLPSMSGIKPYPQNFRWEDLPVVQKARQWAQKDGGKKVTEKHLLLGILESEDSGTLQSLRRRLGDDLPKLVQIVQSIPDEAPGTSGTPGIDTFL